MNAGNSEHVLFTIFYSYENLSQEKCFILYTIQKVYIEANDISGSKRGITAHAIGLSLRLSVFNLALA